MTEKERMRTVADYVHHYKADNGFAASARVRIFEPEGCKDCAGAVVIISDLDTGPSVTNNVEQLAGEVVMRYILPSSQTVFIEHYPERPAGRGLRHLEEEWDLVTFEEEEPYVSWPNCRVVLGEPEWERIDRQCVEQLIGRRL